MSLLQYINNMNPEQLLDKLPSLSQLILPTIFLFGGIIIGLIIEKIVLKRMYQWASKSRWNIDSIVANALKGMPLMWLSLAGIYEATFVLAPQSEWMGHFHKVLLVITMFTFVELIARIIVDSIRTYVYQIKQVIGSSSIILLTTRIVVYIIGILVILQTLGISIMPIVTALGVGGLAISLALQDTLGNFFAGLHILISKQIRPKDFIKLDSGEEGYVIDISWRNTIIEAITQNRIIIPNTKLGSAIVVNYHKPLEKTLLRIPVGVHYNSDLEHVEKVTLEVAKQILQKEKGAVSSHEPFIRYQEFADSSINFVAVLAVEEFMYQYTLKHAFIKALHQRYNEENITIPFPIRTLEFDAKSLKNIIKPETDTPLPFQKEKVTSHTE